MATVVDELVVKLDLDAKGFAQAQKDAAAAFKKTTDEAGSAAKQVEKDAAAAEKAQRKAAADALKRQKELEDHAKAIGETFGKVRNTIIGMFAAFTAGRGIEAFVSQTTKADAALGRFALNNNMSLEGIAKWRNAVKVAGGTAEGFEGTVRSLTKTWAQWNLGIPSAASGALQRLGINDANQLKDLDKALPVMAAKVREIARTMGRGVALEIAQQAHIDEGTFNLMLRPDSDKVLSDTARRSPQKPDTDAAQRRESLFEQLQQASEKLGRSLLTDYSPYIEDIEKKLLKLFDWLGKPEQKNVLHAIFAAGVVGAGILTGKIFGIVRSLLGVKTAAAEAQGAIEVLGGTTALSPLAAAISRIAGPLAFIYEMWPKDLNTGEPQSVQGGMQFTPQQMSGNGLHPTTEWNLWDYLHGNSGRRNGTSNTPVSGEVPPEAGALLNTIAGPESGGKYNALYDDSPSNPSEFSDYSRHPNIPKLIKSGPHQGEYSTAAGKYQFLYSTWIDIAKKLGLPDFSPASQDKAAWYYAQEVYKTKTGRDLLPDLKSNNSFLLGGVGKALSGVWTSAPGGIEPNSGTGAWTDNLRRKLLSIQPGATPGPQSWNDPMRGLGWQPQQLASNQRVETHIGQIVIHTAANDAHGIARDMRRELGRYGFVPQANSGLA